MMSEYSWIIPLITITMTTSMLVIFVLAAHWVIKLVHTVLKNKDD